MFLYILLGCIAFENKSKKAANMDYIRQCVTYAYQSLAPWINLDIHILGSILADHSFSIMKHKPLAIEAGSLESKNQVLGTPFRFLALAPELRNEIYTRVLRPDCTASCGKAVGPCNCSVVCPQILQVCKQLHEEGTEILYSENEVRISLSAIATHRGVVVTVRVGNYEVYSCIGPVASLIDFQDIWPERARMIRKPFVLVYLDLESCGDDDDRRFLTLHGALYGLADLVNGRDDMESVKLTIQINRHQIWRGDDGLLPKILYPLTRIRNKRILGVHGFNSTSAGLLQNHLGQPADSESTLSAFLEIQKQVKQALGDGIGAGRHGALLAARLKVIEEELVKREYMDLNRDEKLRIWVKSLHEELGAYLDLYCQHARQLQ